MKAARAGAAVLAGLLFLATMGRLRADPALIDVTQSPVLNIILQRGTLTVRTWDRPQIQVQSDGDVTWHHFSPEQTERFIPQSALLGGRTVETPNGPVTLPPENVALPPLTGAAHDGVVVRGSGDTIVTMPSTAALVAARVAQGGIEINDYRGGVFIAQVGQGYASFKNVGGVGVAQVFNGHIFAQDSDFAHVRARTLRGNLYFENCNAREIEASTVLGSIVYDNGSFQPGLARFESTYGNVAIGVNGRAQIGAHSASGQILSSGMNASALQRRGTNDAQASFGGGGPLVTATSGRGKVIIYNGSIKSHPLLQQHVNGTRPNIETLRQFHPIHHGGHPPI